MQLGAIIFSRMLSTRLPSKSLKLINGKSLFERFVQNFGARKNNCHFFTMDELPLADEKIGFGVVSFFAPSTRFKFVGSLLESCFYYVDCILSPLLKSNPTVVCSVYLNKTPSK